MKSCPTCQRTYADEIVFCPLDGQPLQSNADPLVGQALDGQYQVEALIARTRTGATYRARHILLGDRLALKIFNPELRGETTEQQRSFQREWGVARRFRHPNAVTVYDLRVGADGLTYLVMEYVEGHSLDRELRQRGRFSPQEVFAVLEPVARALDAARDSGVTCEFLTPADIMVECAENIILSVKLLPLTFNRRSVEDRLGAISTGGGSDTQAVAAPYVAPKLSRDDAPPAGESDAVYSLGVICYELLSGQKPYDGLTPREIAEKQAAGQFAPLSELAPQVSARVSRVVERALAKEEKDRPATVGEFMAELRDALEMNLGATGSRLGMVGAAEKRVAGGQPVAVGESTATERGGSHVETTSGSAGSSSKDATVTDEPLYRDENVQFTVYQPEAIAPARWYTLLAFAHLSKRRPDAPPDEPEPLAEVKRLAERVLADERADYDAVKQNSLYAVPHKGEITFVPEVAGCEFNPPGLTFSWQKSVHKVEFEMRAAASLDGQTARGRLTVFLGSLILADVPLSIRVDGAASAWSAREVPTAPVSTSPYRKIFPSYSHKDRAIVEQIEHHVHSLGDKYLRDVTELRAGQDWQRWMREAIEEADMFQLFWSHNSMRSVYVRQEWEYALSLGRPNFIRPTYWEMPLPESPTENLPPNELRQLHFQHLRANPGTDRTTATTTSTSQPPTQRGLPTERGGRGTASSDIRPGAGVVCVNCGGLNAAVAVFCQFCGGTLKPATQSYAEAVATKPSTCGSASGEFEVPQQTKIGLGQSLPPSTIIPQTSAPQAAKAGASLWLGCLLFVFLLLCIYLLARFL